MNELSQQQVRQARHRSGNPYACLNGDGDIDGLDQFPMEVLRGGEKKPQYSYEEIEDIVTRFQRRHWLNRDAPFGERVPFEILMPVNVLKKIGFACEFEETLGQHGKMEVAGIIDQDNLRVRISRQFPMPIQRFTVAHELGHAVLHQWTGLHRDRPLDGPNSSDDRTEKEADKFAACFLMPAKLLKKVFTEMFFCEQFCPDDNNLYALDPRDKLGLRGKTYSSQELSHVLASTTFFNGEHIVSLASQFGVSKGAMAIRLEELELVVVDS